MQSFEDQSLTQARDLITQRKYAEAKAILLQIPTNPTAQEWLAKIAQIELGDPFAAQFAQPLPIKPKSKRILGCSRTVWVLLFTIMCLCCGATYLIPRPDSVSSKPTDTKPRPSNSSLSTKTRTPSLINDTPVPDISARQITDQTDEADIPSSNPTATPLDLTPSVTLTPTITVTATKTLSDVAIMRTDTAEARNTTATFVADYQTIDRRELVNYPDNHIGEQVKIRGRIFNINSDTEFQLFLAGSNDAVYVRLRIPMSGIYENDFVTVYGTIFGSFEGQNSFGSTISQPVVDEAVVTKP